MTNYIAADAGGETPGGAAIAPVFLLARGFAAVAWGVLATAALHGTRVFFSLDVLHLQLPAYLVGTLLTGWGLLCLYEYLELSGGDLRAVRAAGLMLAAQLYMAPFAVWHKARPMEPFILGNYTALTVALLMTMMLLNLMAAQLLQRLDCAAAGRWASAQAGAILFYGVVVLALIGQAAAFEPARSWPDMPAINRTWGAWGISAAALGTMLVCRHGRAKALARIAGFDPDDDIPAAAAGEDA